MTHPTPQPPAEAEQRRDLSLWLAPLLTFFILAAAFYHQETSNRPADWTAYHAAAAETVAARIPLRVEAGSGSWVGRDARVEFPVAATSDPTAARRVIYTNFTPRDPTRPLVRRAELLVVLVSQDSDIRPWWPESPVRWAGTLAPDAVPSSWDVGGMTLVGASFRRDGRHIGGSLLVPSRGGPGYSVGSFGDFYHLTRRGGEYRERRRGASTVQVLLEGEDAALPEAVRRQTVRDLLDASAEVIQSLLGATIDTNGREVTVSGGAGF